MRDYEQIPSFVGTYQTKRHRKLTFSEIQAILGFPTDHSFLNYKKELEEYGYKVKKISMKEQVIFFMPVNREQD